MIRRRAGWKPNLTTVEGIVKEVPVEETKDADGKIITDNSDHAAKDAKKKKKAKVLRKIPPAVMQQAKGVAIFTSMRSGFAPLGGAGGTGLVMAKLPDGSEFGPPRCKLDSLLTPAWSAPSSISPNNLSTGVSRCAADIMCYDSMCHDS